MDHSGSAEDEIPIPDSQRQEILENYIRNILTQNADSQARIQQLERMMEQGHRVTQQLHSENEALNSELQRTQNEFKSFAREQPVSAKVKPQKPEPFTGSRTEDVEGFLVTLERFLRLSGVRGDQWVDYAASFLRHQADKWYRVQLANYGENSIFARQYRFFREEFLKQFKPVNALLTARDRITQLKQTGSAMVYTHRFLELKLEIHDMSDAEAKDKYMRGLKPHVSQKVRLEKPDTLNEMIQIAQMFDEAVYNSRHAIGKFHRHRNAMEIDALYQVNEEEDETDINDYKHSASGSDTNSETLNAIRRKPHTHRKFPKRTHKPEPKSTRVNYNEKVRCLQSGLCFKCKKQGHMIRNCPLWKNLKAKTQ